MSFLDWMKQRSAPTQAAPEQEADEQAVARYRYLLRTAPPETIEQVHQEAFARLTPEQRQMVLEQLRGVTPPQEQGALRDDPQGLARMATRAEVRQPGVLERIFGNVGMGGGGMGMSSGMGMGGMFGGSFLSSLAGGLIGSAIAQQFFHHDEFGGGHGFASGFDQQAGSAYGPDDSWLDRPVEGQDSLMDDSGYDDGGGDFGGGDDS